MENKDQKLIQSIVLANKRFKNQQFADFIIQSNKIQIYLSQLVILRSSYPDKEFEEKIELAKRSTKRFNTVSFPR